MDAEVSLYAGERSEISFLLRFTIDESCKAIAINMRNMNDSYSKTNHPSQII